jgi:hypothetical protein
MVEIERRSMLLFQPEDKQIGILTVAAKAPGPPGACGGAPAARLSQRPGTWPALGCIF